MLFIHRDTAALIGVGFTTAGGDEVGDRAGDAEVVVGGGLDVSPEEEEAGKGGDDVDSLGTVGNGRAGDDGSRPGGGTGAPGEDPGAPFCCCCIAAAR